MSNITAIYAGILSTKCNSLKLDNDNKFASQININRMIGHLGECMSMGSMLPLCKSLCITRSALCVPGMTKALLSYVDPESVPHYPKIRPNESLHCIKCGLYDQPIKMAASMILLQLLNGICNM